MEPRHRRNGADADAFAPGVRADTRHDPRAAEDVADTPVRRLAQIAGDQGGKLSRADLLGAGLSSTTISRWVSHGRLRRDGPGVYTLGHRAGPAHAGLIAALHAARGNGTLGFHAAAWVDGYGPKVAPPYDVILPRNSSGRSGLLRPHWRDLRPGERIVRHGLPITSAPQTMLDLATVLDDADLEQRMAEAVMAGRTTLRALGAAAHIRPGAVKVRAILEAERGPALTKSDAEALLRRLLREAALPMPSFNVSVFGRSIDAFWAAERLALEVDSLRFHRHRAKFERDRRKALDLEARGVRVLRVTATQLLGEPLLVIGRVAAALALSAPVSA